MEAYKKYKFPSVRLCKSLERLLGTLFFCLVFYTTSAQMAELEALHYGISNADRSKTETLFKKGRIVIHSALDNDNKVVTLLCCLSAFTEDSQTNISFNSPSSTGKSYTALEVARLFPDEDVIKLGNCSKRSDPSRRNRGIRSKAGS